MIEYSIESIAFEIWKTILFLNSLLCCYLSYHSFSLLITKSMLTLLDRSNRTERILVTLKALNDTDYQITKVDSEPEFIYQKGDVKLNDSYEVLKVLCADSPLYGSMGAEKKEIADEWIAFCKEQLEIPATVLTWLENGNLTRSDVPTLAEKKARSDIMAAMRKLELRLKDSPCLVTEDITLADIIIGTCLRPLFMQVFGEVERKNNQNMCVWIDKLYNSPAFLETFGPTTLLVSAKKGKKK